MKLKVTEESLELLSPDNWDFGFGLDLTVRRSERFKYLKVPSLMINFSLGRLYGAYRIEVTRD